MGKIVIANFSNGETSVRVTGLTQWDYGAVLRIQGLQLPTAVEIHFSLQETGGIAPRRVGTTKDGVTDVVIPDSMLENGDTTQDYSIYAWVYLTDETSGSTERRITMKIRSRSKPEAFPESGETSLASIMAAVNRFAEGKADKLEYKDSILRLLSGEKELSRVTITGGSGGTSREIELRKSDTSIQWRYVGDEDWVDLVALAEIKGEPGTPGKNGEPGKNGITPHIGDNGNWYIGDVDTGIKANGKDGDNGVTPHVGANGNWYLGETDTGVKAQGADGTTPHVGSNRHWWIGNSDTGVIASGTDGNDGEPGTTPHIGENNHWWIGDVDTGVDVRGEKGDDGVTPHIGTNNHWYIGETDTGVTAQGADGYTPQKGVDYFDGQNGEPGADGKSAYQYAQDGGYTGTEEEFTQKLATEYPTDVQINGTSIVLNKIADITAQKIRIVRDLMDEVAISDAIYLLREQTELTITLPDDALAGQEITVSWYNGENPSTLSITGNMLDFDFTPAANTRSEISCLWDGTYWSVIGISQDVPVEEVVASE